MREYLERLYAAQRHFNWAVDPVDVDAAIYEWKAAELAMSQYIKREKKNEIL